MNEESYRVLLMMSISKEKAIEQKIERIRNIRQDEKSGANF